MEYLSNLLYIQMFVSTPAKRPSCTSALSLEPMDFLRFLVNANPDNWFTTLDIEWPLFVFSVLDVFVSSLHLLAGVSALKTPAWGSARWVILASTLGVSLSFYWVHVVGSLSNVILPPVFQNGHLRQIISSYHGHLNRHGQFTQITPPLHGLSLHWTNMILQLWPLRHTLRVLRSKD